ncbi:MAG: hypothetical protein JXB62_06080 [Pirellulales bacterium]|nr:hypothetical protein [Pirellulales bacterium]
MRLMAPLRQVGAKRRCPKCQFVFEVPNEAEAARRDRKREEYHVSEKPGLSPEADQRYIAVKCPLCDTLMKAGEDQVGQQLICPDCETRVVVLPPVEQPHRASDRAQPLEGYALCDEVERSASGTRPADQSYFPIHCSHCDTMMQVTKDQVGQQVVCHDCQRPMFVPPAPQAPTKKPGLLFLKPGESLEYALSNGVDQPPSDSRLAHQTYIAVDCPVCGTLLHFTEDQVGSEEACPDCGRSLIVPEAPAPLRKIDARQEAGDPYEVGEGAAPFKYEPLFTGQRQRPRAGAIREDGSAEVLKPPRRPFLSGIFSFPLYRTVWARWLGLSVAGSVVLGVLKIVVDASATPNIIGWISAMVLLGIAFMIGTMWAVIMFVDLLAILGDTAYGYDQVEHWPEGSYGEWLVESFLVAVALGLSLLLVGVTDYLLRDVDLLAGLYYPVSFILFFPVVLLSMLETSSPINPFSATVWRSMWTARSAWMMFYLETAILVVGCWYAVPLIVSTPFPGVVLAAAVFVAGLFIYFRLLGRLAWCCSVGWSGKKARPARPAASGPVTTD